jgi:imidazolonepropionase-like amidohydrolase
MAEAGTLLIRAGRLFPALDETVLEDGWVLVEDGRIAEVSASEPRANGARRIERPDATLLPGLIDCHVHLTVSGGGDWLGEAKDPAPVKAWRAARYAAATLRGGFTTIRTLGGTERIEILLRDEIRAGLMEGPRILAAGRVICMTGGHGWWVGREADGPDEVRKAVREQIKDGADVVKLMATGGVMTPGVEPGAAQLGEEELRAGVEEATKAGKRTASHAQGSEGILTAVRAGIHSIEHGFYLTDESLAMMRERGTFYSATLAAARGIAEAPFGTVPDWAQAKARAVAEAHLESFRRAHAAGVKLVLGTDAGTPFNYHGKNARELEMMVEAGLSPTEGLLAATRNGADLLGVLDQVGTLEPGREADLLLVRGDATRDVTTILADGGILAVVRGGRPAVDRLRA